MATVKDRLKTVKEPKSAKELAQAIFRDADRKLAKKLAGKAKDKN